MPIGTNEVQRLEMYGSPTTGTFRLQFLGQTSSTLSLTATAAQIKTALEALSTIQSGGVNVTGGPINSGAIYIEFTGRHGQEDVPLITVLGSGVSGGTIYASNTAELPGTSGMLTGATHHWPLDEVSGQRYDKIGTAHLVPTGGTSSIQSTTGYFYNSLYMSQTSGSPGLLTSSGTTVCCTSGNPDCTINLKWNYINFGVGTQCYLFNFGYRVSCSLEAQKVTSGPNQYVKFVFTCRDESGATSFSTTVQSGLYPYDPIGTNPWSITCRLSSGRAAIHAYAQGSAVGSFIYGNTSTITAYDTTGTLRIQTNAGHEFSFDALTIWNRGLSQVEADTLALTDWTYPQSKLAYIAVNGTPPSGASYKLTYLGESVDVPADSTNIETGNLLGSLSTIDNNASGWGSGNGGSYATPASGWCWGFTGSMIGSTATDVTVDNTNMIFKVTQQTQGSPMTMVATKTATLPAMTVSGSALGNSDRSATGTLTLPHLTASGVAMDPDSEAAGALSMPHLTISGAASSPVFSEGALILPEITASGVASGNLDRVSEGTLVLPELAASGVGTIERIASGAIVLPRIGMKIDEEQEITATGIPSSGTWTVSHNGNASGSLAHNISNTSLQSEIEGISSVGSGNVLVTGGGLGSLAYKVKFVGALSGFNQPQLTATNSLSGVDSLLSIQVLVQGASGTNEVQTLTFYGTPTGGTYRIGYLGNFTSNLNHNASTSQIQAALEAVSGIGTGNVSVTGGPAPGTPIVVTFTGSLGSQGVALLAVDSALTGGSISALPTTIQNGSADYSSLSVNLISYWRMEETSGGATREDSFAGNNLVPYNPNVHGVTGIVGNAAAFQGPASSTILTNSSLGFSSVSFSVSLWARINSLGWSGVEFTLFSTGVYRLVYQSWSNKFILVKNGVYSIYSAAITAIRWYNLVLSVDMDAAIPKLEFFVDGVTRGAISPWEFGMSSGVAFGGYMSGSGSGTIYIDEAALYSEGVTITKARKLYNSGVPPEFPFMPSQNEIHQITRNGSPSRGTIRIAPYSLAGLMDTPVAVPYNATSTEVRNAIASSSYYGASDVNVTGGPFGTSAINIEYIGAYAEKNVQLIFVDDSDIETGVDETTPGVPGTNEVQRLSTSPASLSGTFDLTFSGQTTALLPANATAGQIQTAVRNLSNVGPTGVSASGGPISSANVDITFTGPLGNQNVALITGTDTLVGAQPTINIQTLNQGSPGGTATTYLDEVNGTGIIALPNLDFLGSAAANIDRVASGAIFFPEFRLNGTAEWMNSASGATTLPVMTMAGFATNEITRRSTGNLILPEMILAGEATNEPEITRVASGGFTLARFTLSGRSQAPTATDGPNNRQSTVTFDLKATGQYFDELDGALNDLFKWSADGFQFASRPGTGQTAPGEANRFWYKNNLTMTVGQVINLDMYSFLTYDGGKGFGMDQLGLPLTMDAITMVSIEQTNLAGVLKVGGASRAPWTSLLDGIVHLPYGIRFYAYCRGIGGWVVGQNTNQYLKLEATESTCVLNIRIEGRKFAP